MYFFVNDKIQEAGTPLPANQANWPEILALIEKGKRTYKGLCALRKLYVAVQWAGRLCLE